MTTTTLHWRNYNPPIVETGSIEPLALPLAQAGRTSGNGINHARWVRRVADVVKTASSQWFRNLEATSVLSTPPGAGVSTAPGPEETYAVAADSRPATDARQRQIDALRGELVHYTRLGQDWDGYGGRPGNPHALLDALRFLSILPGDWPVPAPMLAGSGAIGLYWDQGAHYVSLEFEGDGAYTYMTDGPAGYGGEEAMAAGVIAPGLEHFIRALPRTV
jgi:hypothetical protein